VVSAGVVYFANWGDQRVYRLRRGGVPEPITPEGPRRYADLAVDATRGRLLCVAEDHAGGEGEPVNTLAAIPLDGRGTPALLASGRDFSAAPRLRPDGRQLAWLEWSHPNMPWDGTELWVSDLGPDGALTRRQLVAGGPEESILQPEWSPDGVLHFVSD